jgi:ABC-type uncharacterized transport system ATPase subunit
MISKGKLLAEGSIEQLGKKAGGGKFAIEIQLAEITQDIVDAIRSVRGVLNINRTETALNVVCTEDLRREISRVISNQNGLITQMKLQSYGLEDIYMKVFKGA